MRSEERNVAITLGTGARISGNIRAPGWDPVPSLRLTVGGPLETRTLEVPVGADRSFELAGLEPGTHTLYPHEPAPPAAGPLLLPIRVLVPAGGLVRVSFAEAQGPGLDLQVRGDNRDIRKVALVPGRFDPAELRSQPIELPWNARIGERNGAQPSWSFRSAEAGSWTVVVLRSRGGPEVYAETRQLAAASQRSWIIEVPAELPRIPARDPIEAP